VFVPDGVLHTIPMAVLHDGSGFLVERYATAVTASLELLDTRPMDRASVEAILAGVRNAPGFAPLPNVPEELRSVEELFGGRVLLDDAFTLERIEEELRDHAPSLVHIASHGTFTGDPATSYVVAANGELLTMERLRDFVGQTRFRQRSLDLLVLSACETAAGDERAALGLAGAAIGAGARSALGSLWQIRDAATRELMTRFYTELKDPGLTKAEALQRAQRAAAKGGMSPRDWSPFLLVSNWL